MTPSTPTDPPLYPDEVVSTGDERQVLATFLDLHRDVVARKLAGLSDVDARRRLVPSATTLAGLVKHLAAVERGWFQHCLAQLPDTAVDGPWRSADAWELTGADTVESLLAGYAAACARSREIAARFALDDTVPHERLGRVSLRWIYVHLIE
jgi:hypothetical protein